MENQAKLVAATVLGAVFPIAVGCLLMNDSHRLAVYGLTKSAHHSMLMAMLMFVMAGVELLALAGVVWYRKQARIRFFREHRPTPAFKARDRLEHILGQDRKHRRERGE